MTIMESYKNKKLWFIIMTIMESYKLKKLWFIIMTIMESYKNLLVKIVESSWDVNKVIKNM